jgi:hypothetical protein
MSNFSAYQKILWLDISVANSNAAMNVSQCPTYLPKTTNNGLIHERQNQVHLELAKAVFLKQLGFCATEHARKYQTPKHIALRKTIQAEHKEIVPGMYTASRR